MRGSPGKRLSPYGCTALDTCNKYGLVGVTGRRQRCGMSKCPARIYYKPGSETPEPYNWVLWTTGVAHLRVAGGNRSNNTTKQYYCPLRKAGPILTPSARRANFGALWRGTACKAHTIATLRDTAVCIWCCGVNSRTHFESNPCTGCSNWCNCHAWGNIWSIQANHMMAQTAAARELSVSALRRRSLLSN